MTHYPNGFAYTDENDAVLHKIPPGGTLLSAELIEGSMKVLYVTSEARIVIVLFALDEHLHVTTVTVYSDGDVHFHSRTPA